jgi:hypothetical protein
VARVPAITDPAPTSVKAEVDKLRARLDDTIPAKRRPHASEAGRNTTDDDEHHADRGDRGAELIGVDAQLVGPFQRAE